MIVIVTGANRTQRAAVALLLASRLGFEMFAGEDFGLAASPGSTCGDAARTDEELDRWLTEIDALLTDLSAAAVSAVVSCPPLEEQHHKPLAREGLHFVSLGPIVSDAEPAASASDVQPDALLLALRR